MTSQLWWDVARAGGIVAWLLLAASVVLGLLLSTKVRPFDAPPVWTTDLHRYLGGLATLFVGVHVLGIVADSYTHFGLGDVLVPLASAWHPLWVAWGIVGMYLLLAVELTSLARRNLPRRVWRTVHVASLPLFAFATVHFAGAGTDAANPLAVFGIILLSGVVGAFVVRRLALRQSPSRPVAARPSPARPSPAPATGRWRVRDGVDRGPRPGEVEGFGQVAGVPIAHRERG